QRARASGRHDRLIGEGDHAGEQQGGDEPAHERHHARLPRERGGAVAPPGEEEHGEDADEAERRAELDEAHEDAEERHPDGGAFRVRSLTMTRTMAPAPSASAAAISPTRSGLIGAERSAPPWSASARSTPHGGAICKSSTP